METTSDTGKRTHTVMFPIAPSLYSTLLSHVLWSRQYCSRRIRRIRLSLNFTHGHRHRFQKKVLTVEKITDVR